jgi:hypothetical protein
MEAPHRRTQPWADHDGVQDQGTLKTEDTHTTPERQRPRRAVEMSRRAAPREEVNLGGNSARPSSLRSRLHVAK